MKRNSLQEASNIHANASGKVDILTDTNHSASV